MIVPPEVFIIRLRSYINMKWGKSQWGFALRKVLILVARSELNAGKKGIGISAGTKGLRVSHGADGKTRVTASIPGTGISYQEVIGSKKGKGPSERTVTTENLTHLLYTFECTVRNKVDDGEQATLSVLLHQPSIVSFFPGEIHIKTKNPELGGDELYYSVEEMEIEKHVREGKFLFKKYRDVEVHLLFGNHFTTQYTLLVKDESVADSLINWFTSYKNIMLTEDESWDEDIIDDEETIELTCTHCFTKGMIEDWQIREGTGGDSWWVYCIHCQEEYEVGGAEDGEEIFEDDLEPGLSAQCPNPDCLGEIPLFESDFDEEETAIVLCPHCLEQITFKR